MKYIFSLADINIQIESDIEIDWNPFIKAFLNINDAAINYKFKCMFTDKNLTPSGNLLYHDNATYVYQNKDCLEERLFFLPVYDEPLILYKEINLFERLLYINGRYLKYLIVPSSFNIFNSLALEKIMIENNAFVLHSSFIEYNNQAILFSAPSGTGKSTQAKLWEKHKNAQIINGDRTLIKKENNSWFAYGFPVCGSSHICLNKKLPLKTIIYLSQSEKDSIYLLKNSIAIKKIISESSLNFWNSTFIDKAVQLISELVNIVPVYHLSCTETETAVETLFNELGGNQ